MRCAGVVCASLAVLLCGCGGGGDSGPQRYGVSGQVTLGGSPLDHGSIRFEPQGGAGIQGGAVIENGRYSIPRDRGLPAGTYLVRINSGEANPVDEMPGDSGDPPPDRIPPEFNRESQETVEVTADGSNEFNFTIP